MKLKAGVAALMLCLFLAGIMGCNSAGDSNPLAGKSMPVFSAVDLDGNEVNDKIFSDYRLTVLNIWGTFCAPCVQEMPEIQRLQDELAEDNVLVMGIVADKNLESAREIVAVKGVSYLNLIPDSSLEEDIVQAFDYVPVTLFIDSQGRILEEYVAGSNSFEGYKEVVDKILQNSD